MRAAVLALVVLASCRRDPRVEARAVSAEQAVVDAAPDTAPIEIAPRELPVWAATASGDMFHAFGDGTLFSISASDGVWRERAFPSRAIGSLASDGTTVFGFDQEKRELVSLPLDGGDAQVLAKIPGRDPRDTPLVIDEANDRILLSDKTCGDDGWGDCFRIVAVPRSGGPPRVIVDREGAIFWISVARGDIYWLSQPRTSDKTLIRRWSSGSGTTSTLRDGEPTLNAEVTTDRGVVWIDSEGTTVAERVFLLRPGDTAPAAITSVPSRELGNQHLAADGDWLYLSNNTKLERFRLPDGPWEHLATSPHHVQNLFVGRDRIWWVTWDYKRAARAVHSISKPR